MSYLGNNPNKGSFFQQKLAGDGSTTSFTLLQSVTDGSQLLVTIGNVIQEEGNGKAYTASGATLTFDSAPTNGDVIVVRYLGRSLDTPTTYATQITFKYVATNGQTAFTGSDANGITLSYTIGSVDVYLNGVHLDTTDFTETNESTITLASGATTSDEVVIVAKRTITLTDVVPKSAGGTFAGNVIAGGNLTVNGAFTSQGIDDNANATAITIASNQSTTLAGNLNVSKVNANTVLDGTTGYSLLKIKGDSTLRIDFGTSADDDAGRIQYDTSSNNMRFFTNGTERMRLDTSGNVGIGNTSPSTFTGAQANNLVVGTGSGAEGITIYSGNTSQGGLAFADGTASSEQYRGLIQYDHTNNSLGLWINTTKRVTIDSSGNVGIGTSSPSQALTINDGSITSNVTHTFNLFGATGTGGNANYVTYSFVGDPNTGMFSGTADTLKFATGGTERMRIDGSGNLLVGKTSSDGAIVGHEMRPTSFAVHTVSAGVPLIVRRMGSGTADDGDVITVQNNDGTVGEIGTFGSRLHISSEGNSGIRFRNDLNCITPCNDDGTNSDNDQNLGQASVRYNTIFATNSSINTSDRNEKQDIEELTDAEKRVAIVVKGLMRKYRWKDAVALKGDKARIHFGVIAQDLQDAFTAESLDASKYAMFCSDTWWEKEISVDAVEADEEKGIEAKDAYTYIDDKHEATVGYTERTRLGVRYSELLAFIISAI